MAAVLASAALLASAEAARARDERAKREFESAFGPNPDGQQEKQPTFDRSSPDLPPRVARAVSAWQDQLMRLIQHQNTSKRAGGTSAAEPLSLVTLVAMLGEPGDQADGPDPAEPASTASTASTADAGEIVTVPRELLTSILGDAGSGQLVSKAREDLANRVGLLLDEELLRFVEVLDAAGPVDPVAAVRLYQAEYSLEAAR